jgi:DNA (cytosine-5)-methyltransferase 1
VNELALFAGAGGGILGGRLLGWRTVCAVEIDPYCRDVLMARQNDGSLEPFPIWDDVRTFDGRPWRRRVDVVSGGFPCQDISTANAKPEGIAGARSGLWSEMARIVGEVRPRFVFVENVPALTSRGLGVVLGDLAAMGFDAEWGVLGAHHAGAPHKRDRLWIVARHADRDRDRDRDRESELPVDAEMARVPELAADAERLGLRDESGRFSWQGWPGAPELADDGEPSDVADADATQREGGSLPGRVRPEYADAASVGWWEVESSLGRVANDVAHRMDRLRAIGNGQVPAVAALAWRTLSARLRK